MKAKYLLIAMVVVFLASCTQRTCPTYAKEDVKKDKTERTVEA